MISHGYSSFQAGRVQIGRTYDKPSRREVCLMNSIAGHKHQAAMPAHCLMLHVPWGG